MCSFEILCEAKIYDSKALHYPIIWSWNEDVKTEKNVHFIVSLSCQLVWYSFPFICRDLCTLFHIPFWISFIMRIKRESLLLWGCFSRYFGDISAYMSLIFKRTWSPAHPSCLGKPLHVHGVITLDDRFSFLHFFSISLLQAPVGWHNKFTHLPTVFWCAFLGVSTTLLGPFNNETLHLVMCCCKRVIAL